VTTQGKRLTQAVDAEQKINTGSDTRQKIDPGGGGSRQGRRRSAAVVGKQRAKERGPVVRLTPAAALGPRPTVARV
jgi:hypothetical protein